MRLLSCISAILCGLYTVAFAAEPVVLNNAALKVTIDPATSRFEVLDKRCGYNWKGPDMQAQSSETVVIPQVSTLPEISMAPQNWPENVFTVNLIPDMAIQGKPAGATDCSAVAKCAWSSEGLWVGINVTDDEVCLPTADMEQWWERDSVEFWVDGTQYAVRFGDWGTALWSLKKSVIGAQVHGAKTATGYAVAVLLPTNLLPEAMQKGGGQQFRFAVGINDCDDNQARSKQLYWPTSWVHSNSSTFIRAILGNTDGTIPVVAPDNNDKLTLISRDGNKSVTFKGGLLCDSSTIPAEITFTLDETHPDLIIKTTLPDLNTSTSWTMFPDLNPLVLDRPGGRILGAQYNDGIGVPVTDMNWNGRTWDTAGGLDLPWIGLTDGNIGYSVIWEMPDCDSSGVMRFAQVSVKGEKVLMPQIGHLGNKDKFDFPRIARYSFADSGGHVALCKRLREYMQQHGLLVTQTEKMKNKPQLARLAGAPDVWGRSDLEFCQQAKATGIDRMLVNGAQSAADMEAIKNLGYLISTYDNYEDAYEGDGGAYGDFKTETDAMVQWNGEFSKAWVTHDDPPKQFMKRCTARFKDVASKWIPIDLEQHPYNARFLDVTTACGLVECFSEIHPLDRRTDVEARRALADYVANDLGLVLGGEHGRWWSADIYNYWEGMQSGGFYSWPAGYVGEDIPQKREDIGQEYLDWGLGHVNRYPLWELVFHDCVVSTWYWGDSTGHLRQAAPDLSYKQDAFNILYGTVPLYWVAQPYSFNWSEPETRERLLESYRNTCKLHEIIGFQEMLSHEFVTEDRAVQKSVFADGTEVWVNFGEDNWTLRKDNARYMLGQYGFYVKGPKIEQFRATRVTRDGITSVAESGPLTFIKTADYLHVAGPLSGVVTADKPEARITVRQEGKALLRINASGCNELKLNWREFCATAGVGDWWLIQTDEAGAPLRMAEKLAVSGDMLQVSIEKGQDGNLLLAGPAELADHTELRVIEPVEINPQQLKQGQTVELNVALENIGGRDAQDVVVAVYLDQIKQGQEIAKLQIDIEQKSAMQLSLKLPTDTLDGPTRILIQAQAKVKELAEADNIATVECQVEAERSLWDHSAQVTVAAGDIDRIKPIVRMPFDLDAKRAEAGLGVGDPGTLRVIQLAPDGSEVGECLAQIGIDLKGNPELVWQLLGELKKDEAVTCKIYSDAAGLSRHRTREIQKWDANREEFRSDSYQVRFADGYIRGVNITDVGQALSNLGVSSQITGWFDETGKVRNFEVLQDGPVLTQIRVVKDLAGGVVYDKLYSFYPDYFEVRVLDIQNFNGMLSRAYFTLPCTYLDDKGFTSKVDGIGDAEGVSGMAQNPQWLMTAGDGWALSHIPLMNATGVAYWDGGSWGGISLFGEPQFAVAYMVHDETVNDLAATAWADRAQLVNEPVVSVE